ncbi:hypothetical protein BBF96_00575 [Anoxybacter fermentans]|uniref:CRISPR-associated protein n=1 Tax=Anoxybacter fermentans TaxID=1323375 RepID=A0A3Q9HNI1_9FIRM|nr:hypothetical protein [Anoxybacter fermentans]AZR72030.1 hypothetical protein BBF96_00575 [Anoxybacter fermentans]
MRDFLCHKVKSIMDEIGDLKKIDSFEFKGTYYRVGSMFEKLICCEINKQSDKELEKELKTIKENLVKKMREEMKKEIQKKAEEYDNIFCNLYNENIEKLHKWACMLKIHFVFKEKYISRDDDNFYFIDNPVAKEKIFKIPIIHASSWKGNLHWASLRNYVAKYNLEERDAAKNHKKEAIYADRVRLIKLYGTEHAAVTRYLDGLYKDIGLSGDEFKKFAAEELKTETLERRGRLSFYPNFFKEIDYEVINPLDRMKRSSKKGPIAIEVISSSKEQVLKLFYLPFDLIGQKKDEPEKIEEIKEDLEIVRLAVVSLLEKYGMSAKRKAGYGKAEITGVEIKANFYNFENQALDISKEYFGVDWR